jgi:L-aspartate oxidase
MLRIHNAGAGLCDRKVVESMVKEGPDRINDLIDIGTIFTKKGNDFDLAKEGGHSMSRILHAKDLTGQEIERALIHAVEEKANIIIYENATAIDLLTEHNISGKPESLNENKNCWGAYILDSAKNEVIKITAKAVLATGGLGQVYLHTTNPQLLQVMDLQWLTVLSELGNMEFINFIQLL